MKKTFFTLISIFFITLQTSASTPLYQQEYLNFRHSVFSINAHFQLLQKCIIFIHNYVKENERILEPSDLFNMGLENDLLEHAAILQQTTLAINSATRNTFEQRIILNREYNRIQNWTIQNQQIIPTLPTPSENG